MFINLTVVNCQYSQLLAEITELENSLLSNSNHENIDRQKDRQTNSCNTENYSMQQWVIYLRSNSVGQMKPDAERGS